MEVLITVKTRKLQYHEESKQIPATAVYRKNTREEKCGLEKNLLVRKSENLDL